jgi:putative heme-binding domain-containing protein
LQFAAAPEENLYFLFSIRYYRIACHSPRSHPPMISSKLHWISCALLVCLNASSAGLAGDDWKEAKVPDAWKNPPADASYIWYRCLVTIPELWKSGEKLSLVAEPVDDARQFFLNGNLVGQFGDFPPHYRSGLGDPQELNFAAKHVLPGEVNVLTVRVLQNQGRTGFNVAPPALIHDAEALPLRGAWQMRIGDDLKWASTPVTDIALKAFDEIAPAEQVRREIRKLQGDEGPLSPSGTLSKLSTPDDLAVDLVLSEPDIAQPLSMKWDARGRLWVVEYRQYPDPAGLKAISRDKFLRTVYDRLPAAPPNHFRGEDRISIHEDTDADGKLDKHTVFLNGLSLASSFAFDRDGVWVLNPPYLLFYPDKNHDDVPDGDPTVHLEGFGIEDAHSVANTLRWGPDGWLYAAQGSTVTGHIRKPGSDRPPVHSLGQLIWRYHPATERYEVFAEGGGNAFGVEFDDQGRVYSGHNGGNTRGFHYVQGGYYQKGFGKHGELSNPFTFGYFEAMKHHDAPRFTHAFVIYGADALPERYRGQLLGVAPLQSEVTISGMARDRSSFKTTDNGKALTSSDTWVRPVDIQVGPDGAIYIADFYEQRIDHASHVQGRVHKESGRIYRLRAKAPAQSPSPQKAFNLTTQTTDQLIGLLNSPNRWFRQAAIEQLGERREASATALLKERLGDQEGQGSVELLWALNASGGLDEATQLALLKHSDPFVRTWTIRLACDDGEVSTDFAAALVILAEGETSIDARSQLAASIRRLPAVQSLPVVQKLASREEDVDDIHIPLLLWWAIEAKTDLDRDAVMAMFQQKTFWDEPIVRKHVVERLMRRYASTGQRKDLVYGAKLLKLAPSKEHAGQLLAALEQAYAGRPLSNLPDELVAAMAESGATSPTIKLRQGDADEVREALKTIADESADASRRQQLVQIFGGLKQPSCVPVLLKVAAQSRNDTLRAAAIVALQAYPDPIIGEQIVALFPNLPEQLRGEALSLLASRESWSQSLLMAVEGAKIEPRQIGGDTVRRLLLHSDSELQQKCRKLWQIEPRASLEHMRAEIERLTTILASGAGNPYQGKEIYSQSCGKCHVLFAQGGKIGPDLTSYKRDDLRGMVLNVVQPSAEIREGFENYLAQTADGRTLSGLIADQDAQMVVIRSAEGHDAPLARDDIEELQAVKVSLMPEGLLKNYSDEQVRDLFAYLRSTQPLP